MTEDLFKKSITKDELGKVKNGVLQFIVPFFQPNQQMPLPPELPGYWSWQRDTILRNTIYKEAMWAAAVSIAITKVSSLSWEISGNVPAGSIRYYQHLFLEADGRQVGWVSFLAKHLRDYLTTNNGSFIEIVRNKKSRGSRVIGLRHLDSLRCQRTGDPDIPILYRDRVGKIHELKDYQVMMFSDMPEPSETYFGVGACACDRSYPAIFKLASIEKYLKEKVTGMRPLAIYIVNGLLDSQLKQAVTLAQSEEQSRGMVGYMGAVLIGVPDDVQPQVATIPLAELPDRFQRGEEFDIALYTYADNLGLDVQDLKPLGGIALGSGMQSQVLADKTRGKGLVSWKMSFTHMVNSYVLPPKMQFKFIESDYRDMQQRTAISSAMATTSAARIAAGITTAPQELQILVDADEIPKEFLEKDITGNKIASDDEKFTEDLPKIWGLDKNGNPIHSTIAPIGEVPGVSDESIIPPTSNQPQVWGLEGATPVTPELHDNFVQTVGDRLGVNMDEVIQQFAQADVKPKPKVWGLDNIQEQPQEDIVQTFQKIWGLDENGQPLTKKEIEIGVTTEASRILTSEVIDMAKQLYRQVKNAESQPG